MVATSDAVVVATVKGQGAFERKNEAGLRHRFLNFTVERVLVGELGPEIRIPDGSYQRDDGVVLRDGSLPSLSKGDRALLFLVRVPPVRVPPLATIDPNDSNNVPDTKIEFNIVGPQGFYRIGRSGLETPSSRSSDFDGSTVYASLEGRTEDDAIQVVLTARSAVERGEVSALPKPGLAGEILSSVGPPEVIASISMNGNDVLLRGASGPKGFCYSVVLAHATESPAMGCVPVPNDQPPVSPNEVLWNFDEVDGDRLVVGLVGLPATGVRVRVGETVTTVTELVPVPSHISSGKSLAVFMLDIPEQGPVEVSTIK
jgi:hypothetical protein